MTRKPDLFIVGAPKCGTTSLYEYLKGHPEVFMSPAKEPRYFAPDAAIAQIDHEQLHYLRAHGIPEAWATRLVTEGFLQELVSRFAEGPVRDAVAGALDHRLDELLAA